MSSKEYLKAALHICRHLLLEKAMVWFKVHTVLTVQSFFEPGTIHISIR